ncbi:hypothetical protein AAVH_35078 [Aphelenchoides avenae]|nr:hypothetical protein AAVH_35078 [Aphelenchus avenae]
MPSTLLFVIAILRLTYADFFDGFVDGSFHRHHHAYEPYPPMGVDACCGGYGGGLGGSFGGFPFFGRR